MKVYIAEYGWSGKYGAYRDIYVVVVSETSSSALGRVLMDYPDTSASDWDIREIFTTFAASYHITENQD